jgi:hypothetical protein
MGGPRQRSSTWASSLRFEVLATAANSCSRQCGQAGRRTVGASSAIQAPKIFPWLMRSALQGSKSAHHGKDRSHSAVMPNPSLKRSPNGGPPGPVWRYAVHFRQSGPGVPP